MARWVLALAAALAATVAQAADEAKSFEAASVKRLVLGSGRGDVHITATDSRTLTVAVTKIAFAEGCRLAIDQKGDALVITNQEAPGNHLHRCDVAFAVEVPRQADLSLDVGYGDVVVEGVKGTIGYRLGFGDLTVKDVDLSDLTGRSGSGDVKLSGTVTVADVKIGAGDATLTFTKPRSAGHLDVKVGTGNTVVSLPAPSRVRSSFKAGLGSMTNEFPATAGPAFTISGAAGSGDLTIKKL